ncbi:MAG: LptF/LptG family permease, partial [Planctomycetes bacterium]|nr:LptF/LptG family permease [Planctomycetota bacterium]
LGASTVLRLMPYMAPIALRFAIPGAVLLAASAVFGRMSASNEVMAVRSLGISPMALIGPALVLSFLISLATVWVNDIAVTWGREGVHRVVLDSVEKIVYRMLETQRSYTTRRFSINVKAVEGTRLIRPTITIHGGDGDPPLILTAQEAELRRNAGYQTLSLLLTNGSMERGKVRYEFYDTDEFLIPLDQASKKGELRETPSECPLAKIPHEIEEQRQAIQSLRQSLAAEAAWRLTSGEFESLAGDEWRGRCSALTSAQHRLHRLETEPWRRWANGFSCFFFVLVGAPLAIQLRNADLWTTFGACFFPILVGYYPLLMLGIDRAKTGAWPPYSVWLGNLALLAIGLWLLRRVIAK